jgi:hypothetical protein
MDNGWMVDGLGAWVSGLEDGWIYGWVDGWMHTFVFFCPFHMTLTVTNGIPC